MALEELTRREMVEAALRAAALPSGLAFISDWLRAAQSHQHGAAKTNLLNSYKPQFFARDDFDALQSFTEILIPSDDTPGAKEAHCAHYIDFVLQGSGETPVTQERWRHALDLLRQAGFHQADSARRLELVKAISRPETDPRAHHAAYPAYRLIKQQAAFAFYTARQGMIEALDYKGNSYNLSFPACTHPEHQTV